MQHKSTFTIDRRRQRHLPPTRMKQAAPSFFLVGASKQRNRPSPLIQRTAQNHLPSGCIEAARYFFATEATFSAKVHTQRCDMAEPLTSNTNGRSSAKQLPSGCIEAARYLFATEATCSAKVHSQWIRGTSATYRQHEWTEQR